MNGKERKGKSKLENVLVPNIDQILGKGEREKNELGRRSLILQ